MIKAEDADGLLKEKVFTKLLRLSSQASHGFVLTNFPNNSAEAEQLEAFKGGINAFVHLSLPDDILVDIEENKLSCGDCGRQYYPEDIEDAEQGIKIDAFIPENGECHDCGSSNIKEGSDPIRFEKELEAYKGNKEDLLSFYDHYVSFFKIV